VVFTVHANKPGTARVLVEATIPAQLTGYGPAPLELTMPMTASLCKYNVDITGSWSKSYPNLVTTLDETTHGTIQTTDLDNQELAGTANVTWSLRSFSVMCSHSHSITLSQAHLNGTSSVDADYLSVKVSYDPFQLSTVNCGSATKGQVQVPPLSLDRFPYRGQHTTLLSVFQVGNEQLTGVKHVSIVPIAVN
jgi:hypothetical protein